MKPVAKSIRYPFAMVPDRSSRAKSENPADNNLDFRHHIFYKVVKIDQRFVTNSGSMIHRRRITASTGDRGLKVLAETLGA
jgi:ribosomal protein S18